MTAPAQDLDGPPPGPAVRAQYGVLPYREGENGLEVLLVTSRETRRWIIPKGWPMKSRSPRQAAAQEALEEAGVVGKAERTVLGHYRYWKQVRDGLAFQCEVTVFPMRVREQHERWLEEHQRERRWFNVADAAVAVGEEELKALILGFGWSRARAD